jgi:hypothetical protein
MRWMSRPTYLLVIVLSECGQYLQRFGDEDINLSISIISDSTGSPGYAVKTRIVTFSLNFSVDRDGSYRILHGSSCDGTRLAPGSATSGTLVKNAVVSTSIQLNYDDALVYGFDIVICAYDSAAYKKAALIKNFQTSGLASVLTSTATTFTSAYGGGGGVVDSGVTSEFYLFQGSWTGIAANRGNGAGGPYAANGVSNPYNHGVYLDVNDAYRVKYIVVDRDNNRILIFNRVPTGNTAVPDVVVGQSAFTAGGATSANAGLGSVNAQGFSGPVHASVSSTGVLFVTDYNNHRILGFNRIPTSNLATADFVLGQSSMTTNAANAFGAGDARNLNGPYATHPIGSRLYIVDQNNNRVVVYNSIPSSTGAAANFVIGQMDFTGTASGNADYTMAPNADYLSAPSDLLVYSGRLYVSDSGNHRVLVFNTIPSLSNARPTFVIGHIGTTQVLANQGGAVSANGLNVPKTLVAQNNRLAISDQGNHRVLFYDLPITGHNQAAQQVLGQSGMLTNAAGTTQGTFDQCKGLVFDNGYIWVADRNNHRVQVLAVP